jgi:hypothetical protein
MASLDIPRTRELLQRFEFNPLFVEELGWSQPASRQPSSLETDGLRFECSQIAQLSGVVVFEVRSSDGRIPEAKARAAIHKEIARLHHENLLIFLDRERTQSLWYWVKREGVKTYPRDHLYVKGQPGDLFLSKLSAMVVDISEFDETGNLPVTIVARRLKEALDVEKVTKKFYKEFYEQHIAFLELIKGIRDERDRRWYASILLNRLMFVYFLQRKHFINDGDAFYLQNKLEESKRRGRDRYYSEFLQALFFEGFARPEEDRSPEIRTLLGKIKYLNGGLFLPHQVEARWTDITIPDRAFENLFALFSRYSWNLNDTPGGEDNEINPDVLGYIFEKYINQKAFGAYYTRPEITEYLSEHTIDPLILSKVNSPGIPGVLPSTCFDSLADLLMNLNSSLCKELLTRVLPDLSILDPACGSGAFLVAAMKRLIFIYSAIIGRIKFLADPYLTKWLGDIERDHPNVAYFVKKRIITDNLFGVDIMEEATEIAKLRLYLALVAAAQTVDQLEPLPNIDFNIQTGNSLLGLLHVNDQDFERRTAQRDLFRKSYREILAEKNRLIDNYRHTAVYTDDLRALRDNIQKQQDLARKTLNEILLHEFGGPAETGGLEIKFEEATWDTVKKTEGKAKKRPLKISDIEDLQSFHWGYEFDQILNERGGFDIVIANPPWEVFQTNEKEFFQQYAPSIQKKKLRIEDWAEQREELMADSEIRQEWLSYASRFPHQWSYFKKAKQYINQTTVIDGKAVGNKLNLFALFTEQCFNLLHPGGLCGIVLPSGIYTDLGTKQLRALLFDKTEITGLFGFENRKQIFEGVDSRFKFVVLTFQKGKTTGTFPAAFMRHSVEELSRFPQVGALHISVPMIRRSSPDSLSISEFKNELDLAISTKLLNSPLLSDSRGGWGLELYGEELNMTRSSKYFRTTPTKCPVYEGGMIWHFENRYSKPRYWVKEADLRKSFLEKRAKRIGFGVKAPDDLKNDYEVFRLGVRKIASNTNERTLISTVIPPYGFAGNSLSVNFPFHHEKDRYNELWISQAELLVLVAILNSFVADFILRSRMTTNLNLFYLYQLPVPRVSPRDNYFAKIVKLVAKLICTYPEFEPLAQETGLGSHESGVTVSSERNKFRAELDGMIAHVYKLTEGEFRHVLSTFPLVEQEVKDAALDAYQALAPKPGDQEVATLIARGESAELEFKASARWDMREDKLNKEMEKVVIKTVAAFMNSGAGGSLLIGVEDGGAILGLEHDFKTLGKRQDRDGYENFLTTLLLGNYGKDCSPLVQITFHQVDGKDICRIIAKPSPKPVFVKDDKGEHLFIRAGNSTRLLSTKEAIEYCKIRWKS